MTVSLKPYATYRSATNTNVITGPSIPWLSSIPAHWNIVRSKRLFTARKERARIDDEQLSATQAFGVIKQREFEERVGRKVTRITQHLEDRAHVEKGDFVISMRSFQGGLERAWEKGCIRSSYVVLKPSPLVDIGYFSYLFKSHGYILALQATSNFIRDGQDLSFANFVLVDLPLIPLPEQRSIGSFLQWADNHIHTAIRAKRRVIELLNEQKQLIAAALVLRGIDSRTFEPSGLDYISELPAGWGVSRCGRLFQEVVDTNHAGLPLLSIDRFKGIIPQSETGRRTRASTDRKAYKRVQPGDLAYNLMNAFMGSIGASRLEGIVSPAYAVARPRVSLNPLYFHHLFRTKLITGQFERFSYGIMYERNRLYFDKFARIVVPVPPLVEQDRIVEAIEKETNEISRALSRTEHEIQLIREYRTRLIVDVVTGKLDASGVRLPDIEAAEDVGLLAQAEGEEIGDEEELVGVQEGDHAAD